jgi:hypothetical protein
MVPRGDGNQRTLARHPRVVFICRCVRELLCFFTSSCGFEPCTNERIVINIIISVATNETTKQTNDEYDDDDDRDKN